MVICVSIFLLLCLSVQALICGSHTPQCGGSNSISSLCLFVNMFLDFLGDSTPTLSDTGKYYTPKGKMSYDTKKYSMLKGAPSCNTRKYQIPIGEFSYDTRKVSHY